MATHSPLVAAGAGEDARTYRFYRKEGNVEIDLVNNIYAMNVDAILQSDAFGLVSTFSPETQNRIDRYYTLKKKAKRTKQEETELQQTFPFIEQALGYKAEESETEKRLNDYIKAHWK